MLDAWRRTASEMEQRWNDFLNQAMGTNTFAQTMARSMDGYLALQANFGTAMEQYLRALNIPTRTDFAQLSERIGLLEQRIADLTAALGSQAVVRLDRDNPDETVEQPREVPSPDVPRRRGAKRESS